MRRKLTFEILELGLIAVQIDHFNFRGWPYCGTNGSLKISGLTLSRCIKNIPNITRLDLISYNGINQCCEIEKKSRYPYLTNYLQKKIQRYPYLTCFTGSIPGILPKLPRYTTQGMLPQAHYPSLPKSTKVLQFEISKN